MPNLKKMWKESVDLKCYAESKNVPLFWRLLYSPKTSLIAYHTDIKIKWLYLWEIGVNMHQTELWKQQQQQQQKSFIHLYPVRSFCTTTGETKTTAFSTHINHIKEDQCLDWRGPQRREASSVSHLGSKSIVCVWQASSLSLYLSLSFSLLQNPERTGKTASSSVLRNRCV